MFGLFLMVESFQCSAEIATIVAMMQVQNIFYYPTRGQESIKGKHHLPVSFIKHLKKIFVEEIVD